MEKMDRTFKDIAKVAWNEAVKENFLYYQRGISQVHFKGIEPGLARAIATEAWSQIVDSVISDNPPSGMSQEYYHSRPESGSDYLREQLKHLEIYRYKLGTEYIEARMRSDMDSLYAEACEVEDVGLPLPRMNSEDSAESEILEPEIQLGEEEGLSWLENFEDSTQSNTYSEVVQEDKGDSQEMENIRSPVRSAVPVRSEVVQEDKGDSQEIENIQRPVRSAVPVRSEVVLEDKEQQGIEHIRSPVRSAVPVRSEVVQADDDQLGIEKIQSPGRTAVRTDVIQADEVEDQQGIENIQSPIRSAMQSEMVQADNDQQGIENILSPMRSAVHSKVVQAKKTKYQQQVEHLSIYGMPYEVVQANEGENEVTTITLESIQAKGLSVLYELLEILGKNGDLGRTQQSTPRSEVLELMKHLHDDGIDRTQMELEQVLSYLDYNFVEKDTPMQYIEKYIELILKIFSTESCQRTLCRMTGKVEGVQCWYWKVMQANKEISTLFDELLELVENGDDVHGEEKPNLRFKVLKLIKVLHHYGVDTIRSAVKQALEGVNRKYDPAEQDSRIGYKEKALEVMLRICDIQTCQKTLYELISTTESDRVLYT